MQTRLRLRSIRLWWNRGQAMLQRRINQSVTASGLLFSIATVMVGVAAFVSANNLLFLLLAAMLSTLLLSGFVSRLSLAGLELEFQLPQHVSARRRMPAKIVLRNLKKRFASFSIHVSGSEDGVLLGGLYLPMVPASGSVEEAAEVLFPRRGQHGENSFYCSTRFPFGFTERRVLVNVRRDIVVYPCLDPQPGFEDFYIRVVGEMEARARGRSNDFYRIRPYEVTESARHVDWKATAHTGELQVREFAREDEQAVEIVLDLNVADSSQAWFEIAVDGCAFLAWRLAQRGGRIRFRTQEYSTAVPEEASVYTILKYLALVTPLRRRQPLTPLHDTATQIVFSVEPGQFGEPGWEQARFVGPAELGCFGSDSGPGSGTGAHRVVDHRR